VTLVADPRSNSVLVRGENAVAGGPCPRADRAARHAGRVGGNIFIIYLKNADALGMRKNAARACFRAAASRPRLAPLATLPGLGTAITGGGTRGRSAVAAGLAVAPSTARIQRRRRDHPGRFREQRA
jgi:hypothetical protein